MLQEYDNHEGGISVNAIGQGCQADEDTEDVLPCGMRS
jgi:hypothetical protein